MKAMEERQAFKCSRQIVSELASELNTDMEKGLTRQEALRRFLSHGPNELDLEEKESLVSKFLEQLHNPLIYLLLGSAFVSLIIGNVEDAISITLAILIVLTVAFAQEYQSEKSLDALGKLAPPHCHVIRDGINLEVLASELVVGDIVEISRGDRIPADGRLIRASHLHIDESTLTGEGDSAHKTQAVLHIDSNESIAHLSNIVFMGTMVRNGHGRFIVISSGKSTELGQVCKMMQEAESRKTPLQTKMDVLGKTLSIWSFAIIGVISLVGILQGRSYLEMFTISVSLAVAAIPEGLPIVVTVTLALGVLRMAKRKAIVKKLPAVESLGSVDVICVDKTGTLTTNEMSVAQLFLCHETSPIHVSSENDCRSILSHDGVDLLLEIGNICNNATVTERGFIQGDRSEAAILKLSQKLGIQDHRKVHSRVSEKAFSAEDKWMMVESKSQNTGEIFHYAKGALERILDVCVGYIDKNRKYVPMTEGMRETIRRNEKAMSSTGLRILALAYGPSKDKLHFTGLLGLQDPPRHGTEETISRLLSAGISIVMITGDSEGTAKAIARQLGISAHDSDVQCVSGPEIDRISLQELANRVHGATIFYRTTPGHKMNIIKAFQLLGKTVAMTGDGVNDAPALRLADIGIAMGKSGTDVAKEAAKMILMTDDLSTLTYAVEEGRSIFGNIQNFLSFQLSTSVAALSLIALSTFAGLESPLNPMQILWINILCDGPVAQSLGVEDADPDIMNHPPRSRDEKILSFTLFSRLFLSALVILIGTLFIFIWFRVDGLDAKDQTMTFTCFVFFDLWNSLSCRSSTRSVFEIGLFNNKMWNIAAGLCFLGQLCVIYVPFFQSVFKTTHVPVIELVQLFLFTSSIFIVDEGRKYLSRTHLMRETHHYDRMA